jgi:DNA polymerase-3 subunit alpha
MVHLHTRSCYTLLHSPLRIETIIQTAKQANSPHVALTDMNVMYGEMEFYKAARKAGLHPILGMETDAILDEKNVRLLLLARNDLGLQALYALSQSVSFEKKQPDMQAVYEYAQNLYVIPLFYKDHFEHLLMRHLFDELIQLLKQIKENLPYFYAGICMNDSALRKENNQLLKEYLQQAGIEGAAVSHIEYLQPQDVEQLKILRAIDKGSTINDTTLDVGNGRFWRDEATMQALYDKEDLENTEKIAFDCNVQMAFKRSGLPHFENKAGLDSDTYLRKLCHAGLKKRMNNQIPDAYKQRLDYELDVIIRMGFTDYFLIVWDFIRYARSQNILIGPGRGSAAGSLVAYCLGITHVDPIAANLLFERFLNPERVSMPDIDTDVPDNKREDIISYLYERYGSEHVARIITFSTMKARSVLRDVGRVTFVPVRSVDALCKLIPNTPGMTLLKAYESVPALKRAIDTDAQNRRLFEMALPLENLPRHTSIHAGGIVLSDQPIENVCPLIKTEDDLICTQFTMEHLEELGLIKMDLLALRNLSIIAQVCAAIEEKEHGQIDVLKLPLNDAKTFALLSRADTIGVFQLESDGIKNLLRQMQPSCFEDIAAIIALYRPGPMHNIETYLENRRHPQNIRYTHPLLEPILKETYGIIVYQEQTMQIAQQIGGFSLGQADLLRKAISKKKKEELAGMRTAFLQGAYHKGIKEKVAVQIFDWMEAFGDYGFNKSHAYAYGLICYQMAWLKSNYPLYFYQALLDSVIGAEIKTGEYIYECRRAGVSVLACDVNGAFESYKLENNALRMPLSVLKGISKPMAKKLGAEQAKKPFENLFDFIARALPAGIGEAQIDILIDGGALDGFGYSRATLHKNMARVISYCQLIRIDNAEQPLFDYSIVSAPDLLKIKDRPQERSQKEYEVYGFYFSEHPVITLRNKYFQGYPTIAQMLSQSGFCKVVGRISTFRLHKTKTGAMMCFISLEDETAKMSVCVMPDLLEKNRERLANGRLIHVIGKKDRPDSMLARKIDWIEL